MSLRYKTEKVPKTFADKLRVVIDVWFYWDSFLTPADKGCVIEQIKFEQEEFIKEGLEIMEKKYGTQ